MGKEINTGRLSQLVCTVQKLWSLWPFWLWFFSCVARSVSARFQQWHVPRKKHHYCTMPGSLFFSFYWKNIILRIMLAFRLLSKAGVVFSQSKITTLFFAFRLELTSSIGRPGIQRITKGFEFWDFVCWWCWEIDEFLLVPQSFCRRPWESRKKSTRPILTWTSQNGFRAFFLHPQPK